MMPEAAAEQGGGITSSTATGSSTGQGSSWTSAAAGTVAPIGVPQARRETGNKGSSTGLGGRPGQTQEKYQQNHSLSQPNYQKSFPPPRLQTESGRLPRPQPEIMKGEGGRCHHGPDAMLRTLSPNGRKLISFPEVPHRLPCRRYHHRHEEESGNDDASSVLKNHHLLRNPEKGSTDHSSTSRN
jgi:hypothetical protein